MSLVNNTSKESRKRRRDKSPSRSRSTSTRSVYDREDEEYTPPKSVQSSSKTRVSKSTRSKSTRTRNLESQQTIPSGEKDGQEKPSSNALVRARTEKLVDELPDNYLEEILLDSGATYHMIKSMSQLTQLIYSEEPTGELNALNWVRTAVGHLVPVKGCGTFRNIKEIL